MATSTFSLRRLRHLRDPMRAVTVPTAQMTKLRPLHPGAASWVYHMEIQGLKPRALCLPNLVLALEVTTGKRTQAAKNHGPPATCWQGHQAVPCREGHTEGPQGEPWGLHARSLTANLAVTHQGLPTCPVVTDRCHNFPLTGLWAVGSGRQC